MAQSQGGRRLSERLRRRQGTAPPDLTERIPTLTAHVVDELFAHVEAFRELGEPFREVTDLVVSRIVVTIVRTFNDGRVATRAEVAELVAATVPGVDAGVTLEDMLEVFRVAQQVLWDELVRLVERRELDDPRVALELSQLGVDLITQLSSGVAHAYLEGDRIWLQRLDAEHVLLDGMLGDQPRVEEAMRAARALDLPVFDQWQAAVYLPHEDGPSLESLRSAISEMRRTRGLRGAVGIQGQAVVLALVDGSRPPAPPSGVSLGFGSSLQGTPGLRRSVREAREAAEAAVRRGVPALDVDEALLDRMFLGRVSPQDLADHVLAAIDEQPEAKRVVLIETLEAWLDANGNATEAARALTLHPQSLRYRLRGLRTLLGDGAMDTPDGRLRLAVAVKSRRLN